MKTSSDNITVCTNNQIGRIRVVWVDAVKLFACFLVVFGHLFMSMVTSGLLDESNVFYQLLVQTIYSFHVPLFFVCSGFLYQFHKGGSTPRVHLRSIKRKALALGVPYIVFSSLTLLLKNVFSGEVNNAATPFLRTLLLEPIAPYWYLYTLFLLFCLIPRQSRNRNIFGLFIATSLIKFIYVCCPICWTLPDPVQKVAACAVWFSFGMMLSVDKIRINILKKSLSFIGLLIALFFSFFYYRVENTNRGLQFCLAILFVYSIVGLAVNARQLDVRASLLSYLGRFFMPVYVLHTICAAGIRSLLFKLGVMSLPLHMTIGLSASIAIPMVIYQMSLDHWWMLFLFEPIKALAMRKENNE